jgi:drug/metabolite transporter (DMT)-like permease
MYDILAVLAAALVGTGFVLQQAAAQQAPTRHFLRFSLLLDLLRRRRWVAGLLTMVSGQFLTAWVMGHLALTTAEPLLAANLLFALLLAWPLSRQRPTKSEIAGAVIFIAGVTALSLTRSVRAPEVSVGVAANWPFAAAAVAVGAFLFATAGRRRTGDMRATLAGASAGLVFGLQDALTRHTVQLLSAHQLTGLLTSWPGYTLLVVGAIGLWLMQSAFSAGPLHASLPTISGGEPVCGIALGIVIFGDRLHTSPELLAIEAASLLAVLVGVVMVARGPALGAVALSRTPSESRAAGDHPPADHHPPAGDHRRDYQPARGSQPARGRNPAANPGRYFPQPYR